MKTTGRLTIIWVAAGLLVVVGIVLLVLMFWPGLNKTVPPTANAFEKGASETSTRFVLPPTWTPAPTQPAEQPHPTANRLPTSTRAALVMPTPLAITILPPPNLTQGPTATRLLTSTHVPLKSSTATATVMLKPTSTKKP